MNRQQLLSRLARRGWPVVYSTGRLSLWDRRGPQWAQAPRSGRLRRSDGVLVDLPGRLGAAWPMLKPVDRLSFELHARRLARAVRSLGPGDFIAYVFHPRYADYVRRLRPRHVVYHAYDIYRSFGNWDPVQERDERWLVERADLVIATTRGVADALPEPGPAKARELLNAADAEAFIAAADSPCPDDLARIPTPRIGYTGRVSLKVDLPLVAAIARERPDWHWVFVGPVVLPRAESLDRGGEIATAYAGCTSLPNVHFLGEKDYRALPAYVAHMDANVMCYRRDPGWWEVAYPLKLHEYLASGKPVVSVRLPRVESLTHVIEMVDASSDWIMALERALSGRGAGTPDERRAMSLRNTWEERVDCLEGWLEEVADPVRPGPGRG